MLWKMQRNPHIQAETDFQFPSGKEYIRLSNDEYTLVKLTDRSELLLNETYILTMKWQRKSRKKLRKRNPKKTISLKLQAFLREEDAPLFQKLRQLRMEIARKEKVPPYIVFSDKTLVHMCMIKPQNKEEMLSVSGVGEHKYAKYGQQFLEAVNQK